jgi:hypothetical protein
MLAVMAPSSPPLEPTHDHSDVDLLVASSSVAATDVRLGASCHNGRAAGHAETASSRGSRPAAHRAVIEPIWIRYLTVRTSFPIVMLIE